MKIKNVKTEFVRKGNNITCILNYNLEFVNYLEQQVYCLVNYPRMRRVSSGKAKCNPLDTFDKVLGKKLALKRATIKMLKDTTNLNRKICKYIRNYSNEINSRQIKYTIALKRELDATLADLEFK